MIWLIGSKGMLGSEIARILTQKNIPWIGSNSEVDITDANALNNFADSNDTSARQTGKSVSSGRVPGKITWVINCAAYTNVDKAEEEKELAMKVNGEGALNIARTTRRIGAKLIHISTDFIFDGAKKSPYTEEDIPCPLNSYGKSKAYGEECVTSEITRYYLIRSGWLYGFNGKNFVYTMTNLMKNNPSVKVVNDQTGTPTSCINLAAFIYKIIETSDKAAGLFGKKSALPYGIYNFSDGGECSWFDFANEIYRIGKKHSLIQNDCEVKPCTSLEFESIAERPSYSVLDKSLIQKELSIKLPSWQDSLEQFMKDKRFSCN
ncbi:dTDP-4-dehydrorhamnose reductase [Treponema sp.]|uniref:dTDP-4-dehydrorhamnose reductase n=1 Tax=Treponema sp. TaxID=166 RepID=UPI0025D27B59|nr:dTDP-4-dehydrorhamnose reductase [Treponema sp.]MCR5217975.1 dTDP-4-dehydrorhamnose reductase [Treponema sp.]